MTHFILKQKIRRMADMFGDASDILKAEQMQSVDDLHELVAFLHLLGVKKHEKINKGSRQEDENNRVV